MENILNYVDSGTWNNKDLSWSVTTSSSVFKGMEFKDISNEEYRIYRFPDNQFVRVDSPVGLNISKSGGHRIVDADGCGHYIRRGWLHIMWETKKGRNTFNF